MTVDGVFWFCALAGSGMFVIQFILSLIGVTDHEHSDMSDVGDEHKFKWLSIQAIAGFLMMFGWTALTCQNEFALPVTLIVSIAFGIGFIAIFISSSIFKLARKLHSSGTVFSVDEAIGKEAVVYHRIPKGGRGKITVNVQQFTHEIDAINHNQEEISSFTRVQIIKKQDDNTVVVVAI